MPEQLKHHLPVCIAVTHLSVFFHNVSMFAKEVDPDTHPTYELFYVNECTKEHELMIDGRLHSLKAGQLMICPPETLHLNVSRSHSVISIIGFGTDSDISALCNKIITLNAKQKQAFIELITIGARLFINCPPKGYSDGVSLHQRANAFELQKFKNLMELFLIDVHLAQFENTAALRSNKELSAEDQFDLLSGYMNKNLDKALTLKDMAEQFFVSTSTIQKLFYRFAGCAPMQYFLELKLNRAKEMLCTTSLNYTQISQMLGFSSASYFSNFFKKRTGLSPSEYAASFNRNE